MAEPTGEDQDLLALARANALRLVRELESQLAELDEPSSFAPDQLAAGRAALTQALIAARQTLAALEKAGSGAGDRPAEQQ